MAGTAKRKEVKIAGCRLESTGTYVRDSHPQSIGSQKPSYPGQRCFTQIQPRAYARGFHNRLVSTGLFDKSQLPEGSGGLVALFELREFHLLAAVLQRDATRHRHVREDRFQLVQIV